jgi:hypothetical protein
MSTKSSPLEGPNTVAIISGAIGAIRASPIILGLFLVSGILSAVLSSIFLLGSISRILFICIGIVLAYQAVGGQVRTDSPFLLRLFVAVITAIITYLMFLVSVVLLVLVPGIIGLIVFFVFFIAALYVYARLFLAVPAVMVDGYGPVEAMSVSWQQMRGSILQTALALVLVFIAVIVVTYPVFLATRFPPVTMVGSALADAIIACMQAFLYLKIAESSEPVVPTDTETGMQDVTG